MSNRKIETAVILAAGVGERLREVTGESPKGCLRIGDQMLLERSIHLLKEEGIRRIIMVKGYQGNLLEKEIKHLFPDVRFIENKLFAETGSMHSLFLAAAAIDSDFYLLESDLLYERRALRALHQCSFDDAILASGRTGAGDEVYIYGENRQIRLITKEFIPDQNLLGELVGIQKISLPLYRELCRCYQAIKPFPVNKHYEEILSEVSQYQPVRIVLIKDLAWTEIDDPSHYQRAMTTIYPRVLKHDETYADKTNHSA